MCTVKNLFQISKCRDWDEFSISAFVFKRTGGDKYGGNSVGIEKEEKYFLAAQERIKKYAEFEDETINQVESYKQSAA